jgi:hypothetical protein
MRVDDGEMIVVGKLRLQVLHTPGHTVDSMSLVVEDRVFTGDTLLIGGTAVPTCPPATPRRCTTACSTAAEARSRAEGLPRPRVQGPNPFDHRRRDRKQPAPQAQDRAAFVTMMKGLDLTMPTHITEALRTNLSGGKTVAQMLAEAAATVPFMSLAELQRACERGDDDLSCSTCASATPTRPATSPARACCRAASSSCASTRSCRPDAAHRHLLRVRPHLDAGRRDAARDGLSARRGAGRRHAGRGAMPLSGDEPARSGIAVSG